MGNPQNGVLEGGPIQGGDASLQGPGPGMVPILADRKGHLKEGTGFVEDQELEDDGPALLGQDLEAVIVVETEKIASHDPPGPHPPDLP